MRVLLCNPEQGVRLVALEPSGFVLETFCPRTESIKRREGFVSVRNARRAFDRATNFNARK